jgi:hypothetical protein
MPVPVIVALIVEALLIGLGSVEIVGKLMLSINVSAMPAVVGILIECAVLFGLWKRKSLARICALFISSAALAAHLICNGIMFVRGEQAEFMAKVPPVARAFFIASLVVHLMLYVTQIGALATRSSRDYLDQRI